MARIGILGGTFNPPHLGHVALARHARVELALERVLLMPANTAPNKGSVSDDPGPEHRLAMCRLAVADEPGLEASALEIERGGTSYTVDTVQAIHDTHPDSELTLILGADTARTLPSWRESARLLSLVRLAVAERDEPDLSQEDMSAPSSSSSSSSLSSSTVLPSVLGIEPEPRLVRLRMSKLAVSSSAVRDLLAAGRPVVQLVGEAVAGYIAAHGLYRAAAAPMPAPTPGIGGAA